MRIAFAVSAVFCFRLNIRCLGHVRRPITAPANDTVFIVGSGLLRALFESFPHLAAGQ